MVVGPLSLCGPLGLLVLSQGSWVTGPCGAMEQTHHILAPLTDHLPLHQTPVSYRIMWRYHMCIQKPHMTVPWLLFPGN